MRGKTLVHIVYGLSSVLYSCSKSQENRTSIESPSHIELNEDKIATGKIISIEKKDILYPITEQRRLYYKNPFEYKLVTIKKPNEEIIRLIMPEESTYKLGDNISIPYESLERMSCRDLLIAEKVISPKSYLVEDCTIETNGRTR